MTSSAENGCVMWFLKLCWVVQRRIECSLAKPAKGTYSLALCQLRWRRLEYENVLNKVTLVNSVMAPLLSRLLHQWAQNPFPVSFPTATFHILQFRQQYTSSAME
uniref:Uncharacterized protein n=1 Tax=Onchocerca volvulus TaxID=6282 RepID=A0A8R1XV94_ONCVO